VDKDKSRKHHKTSPIGPTQTKPKASQAQASGHQEKINLDVTILIGTCIILVPLHDVRH
jgi:hypothetical protein